MLSEIYQRAFQGCDFYDQNHKAEDTVVRDFRRLQKNSCVANVNVT